MIKVTVIGGGTGQSILLKGLRQIDNLDISAIVTVADDGGSTGRLRSDFNVPAMGDVRKLMVALSDEEDLLSHIMDYRFDPFDSRDLGGHSLGNLILTALTQKTGNFMEAIGSISKILKVKGDIIPSSLQILTLLARMEDGTIVRGESNIPIFSNRIKEVFYDVEVRATKEAVDAIVNADILVFGVGSLYTSILPNVIIPEIRRAIQFSKAKKVYYCNIMTQPGETEEYSGEDHVNAILKHIQDKIDIVVIDKYNLPEEILKRYQEGHSQIVEFDKTIGHDYQILYHDLTTVVDDVIRHDSDKVTESFKKLLEVI